MTSTSATSSSTDYTSLVTASSTSSSSSSSSSSSTSSAATESASTAYTTFLKLLTTQLQHQDPLNPTSTDTFTQEMIQLSGVEQQLKANDTLSTISGDLTSITASNGLGYIGKTVTASGSTSPMQSGSADWQYTLGSTAQTTTLTVKDSSGDTVYTTSGDTSSGTHSFSWDGTTTSGTKVTSGDYTLTVASTDSSGTAVSASTSIVGTVTGVDTSSGSTELKIGDIDVPLSDVTDISTSS